MSGYFFSWRRSLVELSGCAVLLALAAAIMQGDAPLNILAFWQQLIEGALSPFSHAQLLLMELRRYLSGLDELSILAVVSFGLAGINLLPLPPLNGGNALMYFVSSTLYPLTPRAQEWLLGRVPHFHRRVRLVAHGFALPRIQRDFHSRMNDVQILLWVHAKAHRDRIEPLWPAHAGTRPRTGR